MMAYRKETVLWVPEFATFTYHHEYFPNWKITDEQLASSRWYRFIFKLFM